jgi:hypothetical protein
MDEYVHCVNSVDRICQDVGQIKPKRLSMELNVNEGISISRVLNTRVDNYSNYYRGPLSFTPYLVLGKS